MKFRKTLLCILLSCILACCFTACFGDNGDGGDKKDNGTKYTVTFNLNYQGAPKAEQVEVKEGDQVSKPTNPTRDAYSFVQWATDSRGTNEYSFSTAVTEDITLYAVWKANTADVTFDLNYTGAAQPTKTTVNIGSKVSAPAQPTRNGYAFGGWFTDTACTRSYNFNDAVSGALTLYAKWTQTAATVTFNLNYTGAPSVNPVNGTIGSAATFPADPVRTGYDFLGWYKEAAGTNKFEKTTALTGDITLFAKWAKQVLTVTFDANYTGAPAINPASVEYGNTVAEPAEPAARSGYNFKGWFKDQACTQAYSFSQAVTSAMTLYAGWESSDAGTTKTIAFYYNYEGSPDNGLCNSVQVNSGSKVSKSAVKTPEREGYYFLGWFSEITGGTEFNQNEKVYASANYYAHWASSYVFEAEYLDLTGFRGYGYSCEFTGVGVIEKDFQSMAGASNGYYIHGMYFEGCSLTFTIQSDKAVNDAVVVLRMSGEYFDWTLNGEDYTVKVNDTALAYDDIFLAKGENDVQNEWRNPFTDYVVSKNVSLKEGTNTITLITSNDKAPTMQGTIKAAAPILDCIKIHTSAVLTWSPKTSNIAERYPS